jgi:UDP-3-O-[3-hydroxymyristoyl] glucosamine N-acyltransferase
MRDIKVKELFFLLDNTDTIVGDPDLVFNNVPPAEFVNTKSLDWINPNKKNKLQYLINSQAGIIICDSSIKIPEFLLDKKCFIIVKNPKLTFLRVVNHFFIERLHYAIHEKATIHPAATISSNCSIGPNTYIGKCSIGNQTVIHGNCYIYDNVVIGNNVIIHAGTVIGADGFGYQRNENGVFEKFPHIGGVLIEDDVEIGANTCIDRGALGNTIIKTGAKIDNLVHIAHNVVIGKHSAVIANTMIGGSTVIGDFSWVAPSVSLRDQIKIGNNVTVGMGAVVTKNIPDSETWTGSPAKPLKEFIEQINKLKNL